MTTADPNRDVDPGRAVDLERAVGMCLNGEAHPPLDRSQARKYLNLLLEAYGMRPPAHLDGEETQLAQGLLANFQTKSRLLWNHRWPVDARVERFLERYFSDLSLETPLRLPNQTLMLDRHGLARELSLPADGDKFVNELTESYRVANGVLHNPKHDRRTTKGTFHVVEGGLPVPYDKKAVPKRVFAKLFQVAVQPPADLNLLPYTANQDRPAHTFVSLLLRPVVCPEVPGVTPEKSYEVRFFAPGSLVSNLDFVESIFGNAGDPSLPENDAGLDVEHWTGTTGCVILAPQMMHCKKKDLGLPHVDDATAKQRADGMCWKDPEETYNDGTPFKLTVRDASGVIVTLIADNYFGYCKKEVKTQISYSANLCGLAEEEHAGGAEAYPSYNLGDRFNPQRFVQAGFDRDPDALVRTVEDVAKAYPDQVEYKPEGYAVDRQLPELIYVPEDSHFDLANQSVSWEHDGQVQSQLMRAERTYMTPSGYQVRMERHPGSPRWRLVGTLAVPTFCHKPCTVSGGGKSEISKPLMDYMLYGPIFVADVEKDFQRLEEIIERDYSDRWAPGKAPDHYDHRPSRKILSPQRSLGSVIKLLTPSSDYNDAFNAWLESIPSYILAMVFVIKRLYEPSWEGDWKSHFSVDVVNGFPGHELKYNDRKIVGTYLRVGLTHDRAWRTFKVRQDFMPAEKIQREDDISASVVLPRERLEHLDPKHTDPSVKLVANCEYRLFQRPDDAVHRGLDRQTEKDFAFGPRFLSNWEPQTRQDVQQMVERVPQFELFSQPMQDFLRWFGEAEHGYHYAVCSANPRLIDGVPTKNPRYLQDRPDLVHQKGKYIRRMGLRLNRWVPADKPLHEPVNAVLFGRRNNPPNKEKGIRALAVYNPIHYQELPELFMDFVCSLTGKSPSTTGAGSEGALTKAPFNALRPTADLNNALVSYVLTGLAGFSSAAGFVGPEYEVEHDISLLIPEIWCRLAPEERDPKHLIANGFFEKLEDFDYRGERILASRLGYRMTHGFMRAYFGRVFDHPHKVFAEGMLKPETQDMDAYADGIQNIIEAQQRVARAYLDGGAIHEACPPLRAVIHIMANGHYRGKTAEDPEIRHLFSREALLASNWYKQRLSTQQRRQSELWRRHVAYLEGRLKESATLAPAFVETLEKRLDYARQQQRTVDAEDYTTWLEGTLGADPLGPIEGD